jgi:hypothetical protein
VCVQVCASMTAPTPELKKKVAFGGVKVREHNARLDTLDKLELSWEIVKEHEHSLGTWDRLRQGSRVELFGKDGRKGAPIRMADKGAKKKDVLKEDRPLELNEWFLMSGRRIAALANGGVTTSPIEEVTGRLVTTESGSRYKLGTIEPSTLRVFNAVSKVEFDPEQPLDDLEALFYASSLARGEVIDCQ